MLGASKTRKRSCGIILSSLLILSCRESNPARATLNISDNAIHAVSELNRSVGTKIVDQTVEIAKTNLCVNARDAILVYDDRIYRPSQQDFRAYSVIMPWQFETSPETLPPRYSSEQSYLERLNGPNQVLRHELGHSIFTAFLLDNQIDANGYGSIAPDWLDEAVAISFDPAFQRELRQAEFFRRAASGEVLTLETVLRLKRGKGRYLQTFVSAAPIQNLPGDQVALVDITHNLESVRGIKTIDILLYYSQIDVLVAFLEESLQMQGQQDTCRLSRLAAPWVEALQSDGDQPTIDRALAHIDELTGGADFEDWVRDRIEARRQTR